MPRYTQSYLKLLERLKEVELTFKLAKDLEKQLPLGINKNEVDAICRGGVVLLSSHIEGYITDLNYLVLTSLSEPKNLAKGYPSSLIYHQAKDVIKSIKNTSDPNHIGQQLTSLYRRERSLFMCMNGESENVTADNFLNNEIAMQGFSTPKPELIHKFFKRYGYKSLSGDIAKILKSSNLVHRNLVLRTVEIRNDIAHGDISIKEAPSDLEEKYKSVKLFCRCIDDCVASYFKTKKIVLRTIELDL